MEPAGGVHEGVVMIDAKGRCTQERFEGRSLVPCGSFFSIVSLEC